MLEMHGLYHRRPLQLQMCLNVGEHFEVKSLQEIPISARTFERSAGCLPRVYTLREVLLKYLMQVGNIRLKQFCRFFYPQHWNRMGHRHNQTMPLMFLHSILLSEFIWLYFWSKSLPQCTTLNLREVLGRWATLTDPVQSLQRFQVEGLPSWSIHYKQWI